MFSRKSRQQLAAGRLRPYIDMIAAFLDHRMSAEEFERRYIDTYTDDATRWPEEEYSVLETLFGEVDAFVSDPDLLDRDAGDLDETQLRERAQIALEKLRRLDARIRR